MRADLVRYDLSGTLGPVPRELVLADATLIAALIVVGVAVLGLRSGWLPSALLVVVASAPNLVPIGVNILYNAALLRATTWTAFALAVTGVFAYSRFGACGPRSSPG